MQYTTTDFVEAIDREQTLRATTYPKIVAKKQKQWNQQGENVMALTSEITCSQRIQNTLLTDCKFELGKPQGYIYEAHHEIFRELQRELRMRKQYYPRWVGWGRMDATVAEMELSVWEALTKYYHETYCPAAPWRKPLTRKEKSHG